ncbi:MAG: type III secretion protein [Deltaproteobacteria bacterium]|nr:MAG: type III secretion protein [Deltaproteobacteria bacterium]
MDGDACGGAGDVGRPGGGCADGHYPVGDANSGGDLELCSQARGGRLGHVDRRALGHRQAHHLHRQQPRADGRHCAAGARVNGSLSVAPPWALVVAFLLVSTRIGGFVAACPPFMPETIKGGIRTYATAILSLVLFFSMPQVALPTSPVLAFLLELMLGLTMGLAVRLPMLAVYFAGELIDLNAGYNFSQQINPLTMEQTGPFQQLSQLAGGLLFFAAGGQQLVILGLRQSFERVPAGQVVWHARLATVLVDQFTQVFIQGLRVAAPIMAALIATQMFLALLSRVAPQLNIWGVGFAAIAGVAVMGMMAFAPAWVDHVSRIWQHSSEQMLSLWGV